MPVTRGTGTARAARSTRGSPALPPLLKQPAFASQSGPARGLEMTQSSGRRGAHPSRRRPHRVPPAPCAVMRRVHVHAVRSRTYRVARRGGMPAADTCRCSGRRGAADGTHGTVERVHQIALLTKGHPG